MNPVGSTAANCGAALVLTSSKLAPWYVILSNHKSFRNLVVAQIIGTMAVMGLKLPSK
jgi:polyphosphate kinase 2 (PPK2 family)